MVRGGTQWHTPAVPEHWKWRQEGEPFPETVSEKEKQNIFVRQEDYSSGFRWEMVLLHKPTSIQLSSSFQEDVGKSLQDFVMFQSPILKCHCTNQQNLLLL